MTKMPTANSTDLGANHEEGARVQWRHLCRRESAARREDVSGHGEQGGEAAQKANSRDAGGEAGVTELRRS